MAEGGGDDLRRRNEAAAADVVQSKLFDKAIQYNNKHLMGESPHQGRPALEGGWLGGYCSFSKILSRL